MAADRTSGLFKPEEGFGTEQLLDYQNAKLRETVALAYEKASAVKAKLDSVGAGPGDISSVDDLQKLPITEKAELVELQAANPPFGGFVTVDRSELKRVFASPGPIYEPWPHKIEDDRWAEALFGAGFRAGDLGAITFSFHLAPFGFMLAEAQNQLKMTTLPAGVGNTEAQIGVLKDLRAEAICATPSFLNTVAERCREMGLEPGTDLNLQAAFVAAEMLPESLRDSLETDFGMTVRQAYGTADIGCLAFECFQKSGMHFPVDAIVEIVDPDTGKRLGPGEMGEVVATNFDPVYPLIRFGTGDLSAYTEEECDCGRKTAKLTRIMGRVDQVTKVKGMFIHPGQVDQVAARFDTLAAYRVVVTRENHQDIMTFQAALKDDSIDQGELASAVEAALPELLRVKGVVQFVARSAIPEDSDKVVDERVWD